jgi:chlorite dismutase
MADQTPVTLNHFALVAFAPEYWRLEAAERRGVHAAWLDALRGASDALHCYQTFGFEAGHDLLVWTACGTVTSETPAAYVGRFAAACAPFRRWLTVRETLWGFTRPSQYTKVRSPQEIDPFAAERRPYLIVYPFVKTAEWYLTDAEERRRMMSGHIKVGKQYEDITQLLLYSFGLQDQEFVVVYETHDLQRFLALVQELRSTEARRFTLRDAPLHAGVYQRGPQALAAWL